MGSWINPKSFKQIKIYFIIKIIQSCHPLPWWQLCTLLAFSQTAWGSHLECVYINRCALLKVWANQLWHGRGGIYLVKYQVHIMARTTQISKEKWQSIFTLRHEGQSMWNISVWLWAVCGRKFFVCSGPAIITVSACFMPHSTPAIWGQAAKMVDWTHRWLRL
jgi:hypothetical protein